MPEQADFTRTRRDYVWFALALLCITMLAVITSHG
jgi:hypothetical protein